MRSDASYIMQTMREKKDPLVSVRIHASTRKQLKLEAAKRGVSMACVIKLILA